MVPRHESLVLPLLGASRVIARGVPSEQVTSDRDGAYRYIVCSKNKLHVYFVYRQRNKRKTFVATGTLR